MKHPFLLMLAFVMICSTSLSGQEVQVSIDSGEDRGWQYRGAVPKASPMEGAEANLAEALSNYTAPAYPMTHFEADAIPGQYEISWTAGTPRQAFRVYVQRSSDGERWFEIGMFEGRQDMMPLEEWNFEDDRPLTGPNYYRLRQVTADGSSVTSDIMVIENCPGGYHTTYLYPHPGIFGTMIDLHLDQAQTVSIMLFDEEGDELAEIYHEDRLKGEHQIEVDVTALPAGRYLCRISIGNQTTERWIAR